MRGLARAARERGAALLDARERTVAVLVLLAGPARTRLVAPDLALAAHERAGDFRQRRGGPRTPLPARGCGACAGRRGRRFIAQQQCGARLGVLRLQGAHQAQPSLLFLAFDLLLAAHVDRGYERGGLVLDALEHAGEHLEGLALELEAIVLLRIAAQVDA